MKPAGAVGGLQSAERSEDTPAEYRTAIADANPINSDRLAAAVAACWLARFFGLPPIDTIRAAVSQRHPDFCDWCVYPPRLLLDWIEEYIDWPAIRRGESPRTRHVRIAP